MIDDDNNNDVNAFMMRGLVLRDRLLLSIFILVAANLLPFVLGIALRSEGYRPPDFVFGWFSITHYYGDNNRIEYTIRNTVVVQSVDSVHQKIPWHGASFVVRRTFDRL